MPTLRLFAAARDAAGTGSTPVHADTVEGVLREAVSRFGSSFEAVLASCKVWVNGEPAEPGMHVVDADEVAVLPPVSGGC